MKWVTRGFETEECIFGIVEVAVKCLTLKYQRKTNGIHSFFKSYHLKVSVDQNELACFPVYIWNVFWQP